ncbi:TlpA family protein disulfide reductase [Methylocella sp.]|uniref:TlpA family protein disulfide reductase n=1 Tax=Methylocella sp. TaxID=1978226 RepID=UPI003782E260
MGALAALPPALAASPVPCAAAAPDALAAILALPKLDAPAGAAAQEATQAGATLVHVFATWCEPCRAEMLPLARLAQRLRGRVRVVALDAGEPQTRVRRFFAQDFFAREFPEGPPFEVVFDEARALLAPLRVETLPTSLLLDASGRERARAAGPVDWDSPQAAQALDAVVADAGRSQEKPAAPIVLPPLALEETPP